MDEFYSHIERDENNRIIFRKRLMDHIAEVARSAQIFIRALPDSIQRKNELVNLAYVIGVAHDFGKYTSFFQGYLLREETHGLAQNHSFISAVWAAYLASLQNHATEEAKFRDMLLCFGTVLYHHGNLDNVLQSLRSIPDYVDPALRDQLELRQKQSLDVLREKQLPDLLKNSARIEAELHSLLPGMPSLADFNEALSDAKGEFITTLSEACFYYEDLIEEHACGRIHFELYLLFSALIDADKRDAARLDLNKSRKPLPSGLVEKYIEQTSFTHAATQVRELRSNLFRTLDTKAAHLDLSRKIMTITSPTGSGKTLAALNFAIKLRARLAKERGDLPRIIYALPFTSIIDQNHRVIENVLKTLPDYEAAGSHFLIKHHHLADVDYHRGTAPGDTLPLDQSLLLIEGWDSEIIVTTFIQLFHTLIGTKNRFLKKYHNIVGSIIILDEVQSLPIEYWPLVRHILRWLTDEGGCYVVLMTATQPLIFPPDETFELASDPVQSFKKLDRIQFHVEAEPVQLEKFAGFFSDQVEPGKSYAVVLNTIKSSIQFYTLLTEAGFDNHELFYLSTNIIPAERARRIETMRAQLQTNQSIILVSTQVIEAGVDLDFDVIYRDMAPIDSLVQTAGRANRHGKKEKGQVCIVRLTDEQDKEFSHWIYGKAHLVVARELLKDRSLFSENDFFELIRENYQRLVRMMDMSDGEQIFQQWWQAAQFDILQKFHLIEAKGDYVDVYVPVDREAELTWQEYLQNVFYEKDHRKRQESYLRLRRRFRQYVISVPLKLTKAYFWDYLKSKAETHWHNQIGYILPEAVDDIYQTETGFRRIEETNAMIF